MQLLRVLIAVVALVPACMAAMGPVAPRGPPTGPTRARPTRKYFREASFDYHYDIRYGKVKLGEAEQRAAVKVLMQTYLATFRDLGIETWLMHGSLLGWWWNKQVLPWDSDADVTISEESVYFIAAYYNMTTYYFEYPKVPDGRTFLLEVNPNYDYREEADDLNVVDARWIDMEHGLFIDITVARYNYSHPEGPGVLSCKDGHEYRDTYLYPLLDTTFEGVQAKIPYRYREMLVAEYSEKALTNTDFHGYKFIDSRMEWVSKKELEADLRR